MEGSIARSEFWPELTTSRELPSGVLPTVEYLHRISQIAGKHTLFAPFEPNWGHVTLHVTPRGYATRTLFAGDLAYEIRYELLDGRVVIAASTGVADVPLGAPSVAAFYASFCDAANALGLPALRTTLETEIPGGVKFEDDVAPRSFDLAASHRIWAAFASASRALGTYQASYAGQRPAVGIMWGAFDLAAIRFRGMPKTAVSPRPVFLRNGMTQEEVAVGFSFGDAKTPPAFYAYVVPPPATLASADFGPGAQYLVEAGLASLPWDAVRASADPHAAVVGFADAVYAVAEAAGWPADSHERRDGWHASRNLMTPPASAEGS